jgi:hypothetical protein
VHDVAQTVDFLRVQAALTQGVGLLPDAVLHEDLRREG